MDTKIIYNYKKALKAKIKEHLSKWQAFTIYDYEIKNRRIEAEYCAIIQPSNGRWIISRYSIRHRYNGEYDRDVDTVIKKSKCKALKIAFRYVSDKAILI